MPMGRKYHTVTALNDIIYVLAGKCSSSNKETNIMCYYVFKDKWKILRTIFRTIIKCAVSFPLDEHNIVIFGG